MCELVTTEISDSCSRHLAIDAWCQSRFRAHIGLTVFMADGQIIARKSIVKRAAE
jgi:hypothetical protein